MSGRDDVMPTTPGVTLTYDDYRTQGAGYQRVSELSAERGDVLETPLHPGPTMELHRILRD